MTVVAAAAASLGASVTASISAMDVEASSMLCAATEWTRKPPIGPSVGAGFATLVMIKNWVQSQPKAAAKKKT